MDCWHFVETTSTGQPILRENEKDILIDHKTGLYHEKSRILNRQLGRIFLTTQRIIYIDELKPTTHSLYLELDDLESIEYSSRFLKRNARLIIFLKDPERIDSNNVTNGSKIAGDGTTVWACSICMFTNETNGRFTEKTISSPICENCGIPADYEMTKSTINYSNSNDSHDSTSKGKQRRKNHDNICPSCTFINHSQIKNCEICGTRLPNAKIRPNSKDSAFKDSRFIIELEDKNQREKSNKKVGTSFVQISFRKSDGLLFTEATRKAIDDLVRKQTVHLFNKNVESVNGLNVNNSDSKDLPFLKTKLSKVGITSLENSREVQLLNNDILFNNALTDLNKLMSLGNDIERLYKNYRKNKNGEDKPKQLLMIDREKFLNKSLFLDEIAREIYGFAISEFKNDRSKEYSIMVTLVDLYAMYNKSMRIGVGFISPIEMKEACQRFEQLGLTDLKLTRINGRVLCLSSDDSFKYIRNRILDLIITKPGCDLLQISQTLSEGSATNSWTIGIITEILQNCTDEGDLVIDKQLSGIYYYHNVIWAC